MENDTESEKLSVIIFGQKFCSKLEHMPIKKRIQLRDSTMYQRTPPSVEELNQKIDFPPVSQNSKLPESPFVGSHSVPNSFSKQQADNLKSLQLNENCRKTVVKKMEEAESHPPFSVIQIPVDVIANNADKNPRVDAVSPCTKGELHLVSSFAPVPMEDGLTAKSSGAVHSLTGNVTADSYSGEKAALQPDHVSFKDLGAMQSITQDSRILWDLNVEMDAWEKPDYLLNVESKSDPTTSDVHSGSNLERSEDCRLKRETTMFESSTVNNIHPMVERKNSDGIYKNVQITSESADNVRCGSIREDQQVTTGICPDKACVVAKPCMDISSMNLSCNHELASKTDEHVTLRLGENTTNFVDCAPRIDAGSVCETPGSLCATLDINVVSTDERNCDSQNIISEGEGSVNILHTSDNADNDLSKKGTYFKASQHDVILTSSADQLEQRVSVNESDVSATHEEKIVDENAAPSSRELTETLPKHVGDDMRKPLLSSFREGCDVSMMKSALCHKGATIVKEVPSMDKDSWAQFEQDYEDGELREMDMHCWNEDETNIGEIECLDYEIHIDEIDDLDSSQTSVSIGKGESELKSQKCKLSDTLVKDNIVKMDDVKMGLSGSGYGPHTVNTQLEKKLSGWDQLPKDGCSSSRKVQETQGMLSRTLRSDQHSCSIPTLSEDAEDKETVVERRIRPNDMDDSYPTDCGSCFDKFNGKRRSTPHIHGRNRAEDWVSERRSSVNYQDLYDHHSRSRQMNINSKSREQRRSRSPYDRNEAYDPHISYSRHSRGGNGSRAEGSGRSLGEDRNGYRGSLADDRSESDFCMRPQFVRRDGYFSQRPAAHVSETFIRSRSGSRTHSPPLWVPPYERLGPGVHRRSPEFSADVNRTRVPFWKSNYTPESEMRYNLPPRSGYLRQNKSRWNDEEDFNLRVSQNRSPVTSFGYKENFDTSCSQKSFKSREDFRPTGYRGRMREVTPDRVRKYIGGKDRRKHDDSFEAGRRKRYYKDSFVRENDGQDCIATENYPLKDDFMEDGETRNVNMRKKGSKRHEKYEYEQLLYPRCTMNAKR